MKKSLLLIVFAFTCGYAFSQSKNYWQQEVNYTIRVSLNDTAYALDGFEKIEYHNNSADTLYYIWFHLWPNAYKNDRTAFSDQLIENGRTDFYFSNEDKRGYINRLAFKVNGIVAVTEDHPQHQDIIKLVLPTPVAPHSIAIIETPFHVKLPYNFSRGGHINKSFQITQWYPKPAVYDKYGWHEMPYLDQGEFYSEFGNYDVQITLPENYIVAATGTLQKKETNTGLTTLQYSQSNIHDFAWFADKDFAVAHDTMQLAAKSIDIYAYYNKANEKYWKHSIQYIKNAIRTKSEWIATYPYNIVSVVERPGKSSSGMEYPTITLVSADKNEKLLDYVINHEIGHNWFYGILGTNERLHPWMDEGMNSYYDKRYILQQYHSLSADLNVSNSAFMKPRMPDDYEDVILQTLINIKKDQAIETPSEQFSYANYGMVAYDKTAQWMKLLEQQVGKPMFDSIMHQYYERFKFKHPYPEDFKNVAEEVSNKNLDDVFALLNRKGSIQKPVKKDLRIATFFSLKETDKHNYIFIAPAVAVNFYDKAMLGIALHNYTLPLTKLKFFVAPLYATGSKEFNGIGRLSYSWYPGNKGAKVELAVSGAKFTVDSYTDSINTINYLPFSKIVPSFKYVFANENPRSSIKKFIQWKTFFINETGLLFTRDLVNQTDIITYPVAHRYVNQLQFNIENNRVLYPYQGILQAEQGEGFVRLNFTGNYFFNYPKGGGLNVRFFAGKFIYAGERTYVQQFETDRYHLNLSGAQGYEDYTYNNSFYGRNEFEGFSTQQIMIRDGAFKVKTDLLSSKVGKTDDWLSAINLSTSIPKDINPLEILPVKIPLKIFADVGTYAEAWDKNASTGRFLYDAGLQLSLFRNVINIYVPLLYSKVFKDYYKSTITEKRFLKTITFSIDLQNASLNKLIPQIPF